MLLFPSHDLQGVILNWRTARFDSMYEFFDPSDEDSISRTTPDGSLTIADLMARYTRGQAVPGDVKDESGYDNPNEVPMDLPDFSKMDRFQKMDMKREIEEEIEETSKKLKERDKKIEVLDKKIKASRKKEPIDESKVDSDEDKKG